MNHRRYTYLVGEDILLFKRRYTSFLKETHRSFICGGMGALLLMLLLLTACVGEELQKPLLGEGEGYLTLQIGAISAEVTSSTLTKATTQLDASIVPSINQLTIKIKNKDTNEVVFTANPTDETITKILKTGTYIVEAFYGENGDIQTTPYFFGSDTVEVKKIQTASTTIDVKLANAMLVPVVDENLKKHYQNWKLSVTVGSNPAAQELATDKMTKNLFVRDSASVKVKFTGKNLIDRWTEKEVTVINEAQACTQYTIQCNPEKLPSFTLATTATATHTPAKSYYLNGTEVTLNVASLTGTPTALISGWEATLKNADGTTVRTYTASNAPTVGSNQTMIVVGNWPYLPKGTYKLSAALKLKTNETVTTAETDVTVPAPEFLVSASAYTSYNKYRSGDIDRANACDGSKIYEMRAVPTISEALLTNTNYNNIKDSTLTLDGNSVSAGNIGSQTWGAHTLKATYTFDGVKVESKDTTFHVTGLPYTFNFYNNETEFKNSGWVGYNTRYNVERKFMLEEDGNNGYVISPKFHIPSTVNTDYAIQAQYYRAWGINVSSKTIELRVGITSTNTAVAEIYNSHTCPGDNNTGKSYGTYSESLTFSSSSYVSFHHNNANVNTQIDYLCLYEFVLKYKKK